MALQDILEKIRTDGAADVHAIEIARDVEIAAIKKKHNEYVAARTAEAKVDTTRRAEKTAERILAKARHQTQFIVGNAAQHELAAVFTAIDTKLAGLTDSEYATFLQKQYTALPTTEGSFVVASAKAPETTTFLMQQGVAQDDVVVEEGNTLQGGFILSTTTQEFDCSFKGLAQAIKDQQAVNIAKQLNA